MIDLGEDVLGFLVDEVWDEDRFDLLFDEEHGVFKSILDLFVCWSWFVVIEDISELICVGFDHVLEPGSCPFHDLVFDEFVCFLVHDLC